MTDLRASDAPLCCHRFHPLWVGTAGGQLVCGLVRTRTMTDLGASDAPLCCHRFHPLWVGTAGGQLIPAWHRQVDAGKDREVASLIGATASCGSFGARDLSPDREGLRPDGSVLGGGEVIAIKVKEVVDLVVAGEEPLRLAG